MTMARWPMVPLGELVVHRKHFIAVDDGQPYKRCRVQVSARGVVLRDVVAGADIKTKEQQFCRANEFLVAEIDAKQGGYGIVPPNLDGAIVSSHYFLFEINAKRLIPDFLGWYSKTPQLFEQVTAKGSTNYAAIRPHDVLGYQIPLPPLDEQRRIVAQLDAIAQRIEARARASETVEAGLAASLLAAFRRIIDDSSRSRMGDVAPLVRRPVEIDPEASYPELGVRSFGKGTFHKSDLSGFEVGTKRLFRIEQGDLIFNIVFAWEGAVAVTSAQDHGRFGSHRFLTCVPDPRRATSAFLRYFFLTEEGLQRLGEASPGGAGRNRTLGLQAFDAIEVPVPSLDAQRWFDILQAKAAAVRSSHANIEGDLQRLIPAMLDRVFNGGAP